MVKIQATVRLVARLGTTTATGRSGLCVARVQRCQSTGSSTLPRSCTAKTSSSIPASTAGVRFVYHSKQQQKHHPLRPQLPSLERFNDTSCQPAATTTLFLLLAAAATGLTLRHTSMASASASLEPRTSDHVHPDGIDNSANDTLDAQDAQDPYDNLPEEDEPTNCSICKTYRQGPCRPFWRKVEACTKDHADDRNDESSNDSTATGRQGSGDRSAEGTDDSRDDQPFKEPPCMKYILPFVECASEYRNLYNLIELDTNYTLGIADLEKEADETLCWNKTHEPVVDWTAWTEFLDETPDWKPAASPSGTIESTDKTVSTQKPLWKTLKGDENPSVVSVDVYVPVEHADGVGQLECAYALDQSGHVVGFVYGHRPSASDSKDDAPSSEPCATMKVRILPEHTTSFSIGASYLYDTHGKDSTGGETDGSPSKKTKAHIYKSREIAIPTKE